MNDTIASRHTLPRAVLLTALTAGIVAAMLVFRTGIAHDQLLIQMFKALTT